MERQSFLKLQGGRGDWIISMLAATGLGAATGFAALLFSKTSIDETSKTDFIGLGFVAEQWSLQSTMHGLVSADDMSREWLLIVFGSDDCRPSCTKALRAMSSIISDSSSATRFRPLFFSIAPGAVAADKLKINLAAIDSRIEGLSGEPQDINAAARALGLSSGDICGPSAEVTAAGLRLTENASLYLFAPGGRLVTVFGPDLSAGQASSYIRELFASGP